ncbi:MAG TPA: RagB/SusD family nutrient uptake outer membrane protein [Puia sp.]|nr:RagB/SusD family nutrient uptake outer membrane protein [Puia sp.]
MKRILIYINFSLLLLGSLSSCHKVEVAINSELTPDVYPQTAAQFNSATGPVYVALRGNYSVDYYFLQTLSSSEAILPAFGGNWYDGDKYEQLHKHSWNKDNAWVNSVWTYLENVIGTTNQTLYILSPAPDGSAKQTTLAELKTVRALCYFLMMDLYANVPIDSVYGNTTLHTNTPRPQLFTYVESELKAAIPYLNRVSGQAQYGRPNAYTAWTILAKMYLNAGVYTGTQRNDDCIAACDSVINSGLYSLEPMSTYLQMFYPTNGPTQKEFIFAIPYDASTTNGYMFHARYDLNRNLGIRYKYSGSTNGSITDPVMNQTYPGSGLLNSQPSGPQSVLPEYYAYFSDPNDVRNGQWLTGLQYWPDGQPLMVTTTNKGYDASYSGSSPAATYTYQLNLTPGMQFRSTATGANPSLFDFGNDEIAWNMGYRNIKFYPDYTNTVSRNQNNDVPVFRYSDIILMKAEAILRGGTATQGQTALSLANQLRAVRTTTPAWTTITVDSVYAERCREFSWECWHRNDMIRFGKFEDSYGFKTDSDPNHRIFPIPTTALSTNATLTQNPGY